MDNQLQKMYRELFAKIIPRPVLFFDVNVTEHCNLSCKGCGSFAPLAKEEFLDVEEYNKDIKRLSEIGGGLCQRINILGGEPLLHKEICKIMALTRENFPVGIIRVVTNGILLTSMPDEFWKTCKENKITISPTKYPVKIDYDAIEKKAKRENVLVRFFGDVRSGYWQKIVMDLDGERNENHSFMNCLNANVCPSFSHGKLYKCVRIAKIRHFNSYYDLDLPVTPLDYIDIYDDVTLEDVMKFLSSPAPFCRFCNTFANHSSHWESSKRDIKEWT